MGRPLLSATLIVKDEAAFLPDCLASIAPVVDEIVVVDTGSGDDSREIARRFGAQVVEAPWTDDFSAARNVSLERATGEWILYIDADERLRQVTREAAGRLLASAEEVAFRILLRPTVGSTAYREFRLWRNDPRIRFEGIIHEKVVPAIGQVAEEEGRAIGSADWLLEHVGYEGDQTRKHHRNLPLLRRELEREPENLFVRHHLFRVLAALGEAAEAEAALVGAVEWTRASGMYHPLASLSFADLIRIRHGRGEDVSALLDEAVGAYPDNCLLRFLAARARIDAADPAGALEHLDRILAVARRSDPGWDPAYDRRLVGELTWDARALCLFRLGDFEGAAEAYAEAARSAPADPAYPVKCELARARARARRRPTRDPRRPTRRQPGAVAPRQEVLP